MESFHTYPRELDWALIAIAVLLLAATVQAAVLVREGRATKAWLRAPKWLGVAALLFSTFGLALGVDYWIFWHARIVGDLVIGYVQAGALHFFFGTVLAAAGLVASFVLECRAARREGAE
jgi:hypothetical protein